MKTAFLTCLAALAASPALAHPGPHHHPHGITAGWIVVAAVLVAAPLAGPVLRRVRA